VANIIVTVIAVDKITKPIIIGLDTISSIDDIIVKMIISVKDSIFIILGIAPIL
jgi:hypothetical protein